MSGLPCFFRYFVAVHGVPEGWGGTTNTFKFGRIDCFLALRWERLKSEDSKIKSTRDMIPLRACPTTIFSEWFSSCLTSHEGVATLGTNYEIIMGTKN